MGSGSRKRPPIEILKSLADRSGLLSLMIVAKEETNEKDVQGNRVDRMKIRVPRSVFGYNFFHLKT
jgi:hypothetical protein